jgi:hypothetical protein
VITFIAAANRKHLFKLLVHLSHLSANYSI